MNKMERQLRRDIKGLGMKLLSLKCGRKHRKAIIEASGRRHLLIVPVSPSDHRAAKNMQAHLRRLSNS